MMQLGSMQELCEGCTRLTRRVLPEVPLDRDRSSRGLNYVGRPRGRAPLEGDHGIARSYLAWRA